MFSFFKKKGGKSEAGAENSRVQPSDGHRHARNVTDSVDACVSRADNDVTNEKPTAGKDVVNLLIPETDYSQKSGVGALLQMMAGKRRRNRKRPGRTESVRVSPPKETATSTLQRSKSERELKRDGKSDVDLSDAKNTQPARPCGNDDSADFVKALVLQKYANKTPDKQHVSLVYVSNPELDEKRHAEALLREIARSIDCTIDEINVTNDQHPRSMGNGDSKAPVSEPVYETIEDDRSQIDAYKSELKGELDKLLQNEEAKDNETEDNNNISVNPETRSLESPGLVKKSNLKLPKSDTEACSDDDRSECSKKRVTFRKHVVFDDGDQQTDEEICSSFESLTSSEEEDEYLEELPDNDELLGGYVVSRNEENINKTVINLNEDNDGLKRISSDNSDSGFIDDKQNDEDLTSDIKTIVEESESASESEEETETETETEEEIIEVIEEIEEVSVARVVEPEDDKDEKSLVSQESRFQSQVSALSQLADSRCGEAETARALIIDYRKQLEEKEAEIAQLKCELAAAYKESELVRQRGRSLEEELSAARDCSAELADQLRRNNDESIRHLQVELEDAQTQRAQLESRVHALERDCDRLEREKNVQEQRAQEALAAAEANTVKWRAAHEAARSQAAARAERMLADCEWKMRELEKKARDAEKQNKELTTTVKQLRANPPEPAGRAAELQQLRGLVAEQQRAVQSLGLQLQKVETREEALKLEVHRLKEMLDKETRIGKEKEDRHMKTIERLEQQHTKSLETLKAEQAISTASSRAALERAHGERTRAALAGLRAEAERDARSADRKLREVTTRFENLKEVLAKKETQFEKAICDAHSKADWDIMQLRHLLDKADITYANNVEKMNERFESERDRLNEEWSEKLRLAEEQASSAAEEAGKLLENTRMKLVAERNDMVNKLKEKHRQEMEDQWERFMTDKENCLTRMKSECIQEGEEERVKREKELIEEIAELKSLIQSKDVDFSTLEVKSAACGRTLAVTEQELREALTREKDLREKRAEDSTKIKQAERAARDQVEHLTRKCACLKKLFDDMRARLSARERVAEQESRAKDKEIHQLKAEVARLTKMLVEESSPKLGARTRADGCETLLQKEAFDGSRRASDCPNPPRRKGGTLRTPESLRKRPTLPELPALPPEARKTAIEIQNGRRRAKSVDLPAVQVPVRIKQYLDRSKEQ